MKLSVVIPVYNVARPLLDECFHSVAMQSLRSNEYEIVLVDDCSTLAETRDCVFAFVEKTPNARLVRHEENKGLNESRRTGVHAADSDFLVFVDGDDILTRDALECLRMEAANTRADLVTAPYVRWDLSLHRYSDNNYSSRSFPAHYIARLKETLAGRRSFTMCGRLFNKHILTDDVFDLPPRLYHEDLACFVRSLYKVRVCGHVKNPLYFYSVNSASITGAFTLKHAEDIFWSLNDWADQARRHQILSKVAPDLAAGAERFAALCVDRCLASEQLSDDEKMETLAYIKRAYNEYKIKPPAPTPQNLKTLVERDENAALEATSTGQNANAADPETDEAALLTQYPRGLQPSGMAKRLKEKIVFICQVDYQLRNAAAVAKHLSGRGFDCVVLDNSAFASGGKRQLAADEREIFADVEYVKIVEPPYGEDYLSGARVVIIYNDFNDDFRAALEYRHRMKLPSVCVVEGISDFLRHDFDPYRLLPYRRCDHVFLAGEDDAQYFEDRDRHIVGLPIIESLAQKKPRFPTNPIAALNVNFTYGVLETERDGFVQAARDAFEALDLAWVITKHPADTARLRGLPVTKKTQYQLIDDCSVFVSRFATGILEALASGKPAIYFNPHREKVQKFTVPMGAFPVAHTAEELKTALKQTLADIEKGVDFRARAADFLEHHTAFSPDGETSATRFCDAVETVIRNTADGAGQAEELFKKSAKWSALHSANAAKDEKNPPVDEKDGDGPAGRAQADGPASEAPSHSFYNALAYFDGATSVETAPDVSGARRLALECAFISGPLPKGAERSETFPPMPLVAGPLSIYQFKSDEITVNATLENGKGKSATLPIEENQPVYLQFLIDMGDQTAAIYLNDELAHTFEKIDPHFRLLRIGKGFEERFWTGRMLLCRLWDVSAEAMTASDQPPGPDSLLIDFAAGKFIEKPSKSASFGGPLFKGLTGLAKRRGNL
ncbi:MAG: glycosyltransferase family A protein [Pseudomonadota bacterium]